MRRMKLVVMTGIVPAILAAALGILNAQGFLDSKIPRFLSTKYNGKKIFGKEGQNLNLTWKYKIPSLPPYGTKVMGFLFEEWIDPRSVSKRCFIVDENGKVYKAKGYEAKYDYKSDGSDGNYTSNVVMYNLTKSDMEKKYGIKIYVEFYRRPLEDWFELHTFVKAKITHFSISGNATVKKGDAVNITCQATGRPKAIVTLYKQDKIIKKGKGEVKHHIHKPAMHHAGEYVCVASNDDAEVPDRRNITLSVEAATTQSPASRSASDKCFSDVWILGFLLFSRWI